MRRYIFAVAVLAAAGLAGWWWVTRPEALEAGALDGLTPDPARGEVVFAAAGCASCHAAEGAEGEDRLILQGGQRFASPFGEFVAPNISPHPTAGIGDWTDLEIVNAVRSGVSPGGRHYYPAFPYTAYAKAELADLVSLVGYLRTLPESDRPSEAGDVPFPFNFRRNLGVWKALNMGDGWTIEDAETPEIERGRYLVEALSHCGECHTPRGPLGGLDMSRWLAGAPNPSGKGRIPNLTPAALDWSAADIAAYLESGFTPDFDTAGGLMTEVIRNTSQLSDADRQAIAAYVKALPPAE